jgi:superoxide dismutase, Cu-Zn family
MTMTKKHQLLLLAAGLGIAGLASADYKVTMNAIDAKGVGVSLGTVTISARGNGGTTFTPNLKGLPAGTHGFHVHEFPNCGAKEKDGKLEPGESAGAHYDPKKTKQHTGPTGLGHEGDLPPLVVSAAGTATQAVDAPRLDLKSLSGKSLMIHEGGDNGSDQPKPNGGGGTRIACGIIEKGDR